MDFIQDHRDGCGTDPGTLSAFERAWHLASVHKVPTTIAVFGPEGQLALTTVYPVRHLCFACQAERPTAFVLGSVWVDDPLCPDCRAKGVRPQIAPELQ